MVFDCRIWGFKTGEYVYPRDNSDLAAYLVMHDLAKKLVFHNFIGKTDYNGKKVYVGDFVQVYYKKKTDKWNEMTGVDYGIVTFDKDTCSYVIEYKNDKNEVYQLEIHDNFFEYEENCVVGDFYFGLYNS